MAIGLLVVLAAAAFIVARLPGSPAPGATAPGVAASASPGGSPAASAAATPSPPPSPPATPAPSPVASRTPSPAAATQPPTAVPSAVTRTYRVQAGDTLIAIAARFGVSVEELQQLNGVKDPRLLRVGQVLRIP